MRINHYKVLHVVEEARSYEMDMLLLLLAAHLHVDDVVVDVVAGSGYTGVVLSRHLCHDLSHRSPANF